MGFRNKRQSTDQTNQSARSTAKQSTATESSAEQSTPHHSQMGQVWPSIERAEEHFGIEIPDESTLQRLELHEQTYGRETHDWIAEGMPVDAMGSPRDMEAFRQRQAERPPEVPTNIERQNRRSVLRSEKAAGDTSPAGETGVPEPVREVISSRGRSLDGSIQRAMEDRMGDSFSDVRIHTGSTAADACESINARAFTVGNHIAFNSGEYDPESPEGQHVLAHELAHVRQQNQGAVSMLPQEDMELEVDPDPALEREAEEAAQQAMADGSVVVSRMGCEMQIQRVEKGRAKKMHAILAGNAVADDPTHLKQLDELALSSDRIDALDEQLGGVRPETLVDPETDSGISLRLDQSKKEKKYAFVTKAVEVLEEKEAIAERFDTLDAELEDAVEERRQLERQVEHSTDGGREVKKRLVQKEAEIHELKSQLIRAHVELSEAVELADQLWNEVNVQELESYYLDGEIDALRDELISQWTIEKVVGKIPGVSEILSVLKDVRDAGEKFLRIKRARDHTMSIDDKERDGVSQADELGK